MAHSSQIEDEVDALYDLRPGEFVAARDALAKQVRRTDKAEAERIKALARPSAAAWAVNQLARREPEWMQALVTAGQRMTEAHQALLERGDRDGWRAASAESREAIDRLVRLAEGLLREERGSVSAQLREQVRETLQAATLDPDARELVAAGRLAKELRPPGGLPDVPSGRFARPATTPSGTGPRGSIPRSRTRGTDARFERQAGAAAEREARAARKAAERDARSLLRRVERERASAASTAERAEQALLRAEKAREAAAEELATAQRAVDDRERELAAAERANADAHAQLEARDEAIAAARDALDAFGPAGGSDADG